MWVLGLNSGPYAWVASLLTDSALHPASRNFTSLFFSKSFMVSDFMSSYNTFQANLYTWSKMKISFLLCVESNVLLYHTLRSLFFCNCVFLAPPWGLFNYICMRFFPRLSVLFGDLCIFAPHECLAVLINIVCNKFEIRSMLPLMMFFLQIALIIHGLNCSIRISEFSNNFYKKSHINFDSNFIDCKLF